MLGNLFQVLLTFLLYLGLKFIFQPYVNWKKQRSKSGGVTEYKIISAKGSLNYDQYVEQNKNKKVELSLIVPAYNEEERLPVMLKKALPFFQKLGKSYEIIVVNDASKDNTTKVALGFSNFEGKDIDLSVLEYINNKGKGGAVRSGMLLANGEYRLFLDADGATEITEFNKVFKIMQDTKIEVEGKSYGVVAGSRNHIQEGVIKERKWYRNVLMHISNFIVNVICGVKLKDTQCGFKLFTKESADRIFKVLHLDRWAFDVELFMIANNYKIPVQEIPVNWKDVDGSKLNVVEASVTMARDFLLVRLLYLFGIWKYSDNILELKQ